MNPLLLTCRALETIQSWYGNINPLSIAYATRLGLGPTNPGMITIAQENLALSVGRILTCLEVTHSNILSCCRSTRPFSPASLLTTTLLYHSLAFYLICFILNLI